MIRLIALLLMLPCAVFASDRALYHLDENYGKFYSQKAALVIGEYAYTGAWPSLPGVKQDITAVSAALKSDGFDVTRLDNPDRKALTDGIDAFIRRYGSDPNAALLIYFAGHGHTMKESGEDTGYVVLKDAADPNKDPENFRKGSLPIDYFAEKAKDTVAKHTLFVFDSCFSGSIFAAVRSIPDFSSDMLSKKAREFITSGTAYQQVPDQSVFRQKFMDGISGGADLNLDGIVTGSELGMYVQKSVSDFSGGSQTPVFGKMRDVDGEFVFVPKKQELIAAKPQKHEDVIKPVPAVHQDLSERDRLVAVISANPNSKEAYEAMKRLREIDDSFKNQPPVTAPESHDIINTTTSTETETVYQDSVLLPYPFVVIAPVKVNAGGYAITAAFTVKAADQDSYMKLSDSSDALAYRIAETIKSAGISPDESMIAIREKVKQAAARAVEKYCDRIIGSPALAGLTIK